MDESSRNIVKFIGAGTGAILLLMAAWFYAQTQRVQPVPAAAEATATPANPESAPAGEVQPAQPVSENTVEDLYPEEIEPIDGKPSMLTAEEDTSKE